MRWRGCRFQSGGKGQNEQGSTAPESAENESARSDGRGKLHGAIYRSRADTGEPDDAQDEETGRGTRGAENHIRGWSHMDGLKFMVIDKTTGKEADMYSIALKEKWAEKLCFCDMEGFAILDDGSLILCDECGRFEFCDPDRFEVKEV